MGAGDLIKREDACIILVAPMHDVDLLAQVVSSFEVNIVVLDCLSYLILTILKLY